MKIVFLFLFAVFSFHANATNYYITSSGNDSNNGTSISTPWKTIAKINTRTFLPNDFIFFRRGDMWREQINLRSSGAAGSSITYADYGTGTKPIINGADIITNWTNAGGNLWYVNNPTAVQYIFSSD